MWQSIYMTQHRYIWEIELKMLHVFLYVKPRIIFTIPKENSLNYGVSNDDKIQQMLFS